MSNVGRSCSGEAAAGFDLGEMKFDPLVPRSAFTRYQPDTAEYLAEQYDAWDQQATSGQGFGIATAQAPLAFVFPSTPYRHKEQEQQEEGKGEATRSM